MTLVNAAFIQLVCYSPKRYNWKAYSIL